MRVMVTVSVDTGDGKWQNKTLTMSGDPAWCGRRWREYFPVLLEKAIDGAAEAEVDDEEEDDERVTRYPDTPYMGTSGA